MGLGMENGCLEMITTMMEVLLFALMLLFLKISSECKRWRDEQTRPVVQVDVFDAPLFRWLPSFHCVASRFGFGSTTLFTALRSSSTTAGTLL